MEFLSCTCMGMSPTCFRPPGTLCTVRVPRTARWTLFPAATNTRSAGEAGKGMRDSAGVSTARQCYSPPSTFCILSVLQCSSSA